jgi:5S rRNA maturation endonuclease (ribonuclease M5)
VTAAELAARLPDARRTSNGWEARCPAHEDRNASLGIAEGKDGRVLLNCHAGCTFAAIVAALGVKSADLFPPKPEGKGRTRGRIVATYDYTDAAGKLLFQVVRFDPKDFRQRRPDQAKPGAWTWNLNGQTRVLYRLPDVIRAKTEGRAVFCVEGEKDAEALAALGLCATCNPGGAGKWTTAYTESLTGAKVFILPDKDTPGRRHAALVTRALAGKAQSVRVVELPDRDGRKVKDAADWIGAGGTVEELREIVRTAPAWEPPPEHPPAAAPSVSVVTNGKPAVLLPHGAQSISDTGRALGELLAKTERYFIRGGAVVKLAQDPDGLPHLEDVRAAALASDFEAVAFLCKPDGPGNVAAATCPEQTAKLLAASAAFRDAMRPIHVLTRCPVLIERGRGLLQVSGYDRESGILAAGMPAEAMDVAEAVRLLREVLAGFRFATPADHARALAAMVTPALVFGGLVKNLRAPVDLGEADASQTGKGYRNKLTAAVYAQSVKTVTQQRAGVGSMEESFNMALIRGANFIALDNVRGKIDSPSFESFLTEDTYHARAPYREPVEIDPRRVVIMLTSNKADVTPDLANRCACVRLLKQPEGHAFTHYPEGDILEHVRANQARYLGAVFAIVRAWHDAGKPRTTETRHDFRPWAQVLDWITRNLLDAGPLLDGHRETQARMTNPVLNWLRDVALEVIRARQAGAWLRASDLVDLIAESGTETPGLPEHGDLTDPETRTNALQATGRRLGLCFRAGDILTLDGMTIERREGYDAGRFKPAREYRFTAPPMDGQTIGGTPKPTPDAAEPGLPETPARDVSAYDPPMRPPMKPPMKSLIPPMPPMPPPKCEHEGTATIEGGDDIASMETHRRIGGTPAPVDPDEVNAALALAAAEDAAEYEEGEL